MLNVLLYSKNLWMQWIRLPQTGQCALLVRLLLLTPTLMRRLQDAKLLKLNRIQLYMLSRQPNKLDLMSGQKAKGKLCKISLMNAGRLGPGSLSLIVLQAMMVAAHGEMVQVTETLASRRVYPLNYMTIFFLTDRSLILSTSTIFQDSFSTPLNLPWKVFLKKLPLKSSK